MPDNTLLNPGTGGDTIATDDVTTLNGSASSGVKVQRVKPSWGADGTATDVSLASPLPVTPMTGDVAITVTPAAALNADLFSVDATGYGHIFLQTGGTWSASLTFQGSNDGTTWYIIPDAFNSLGIVSETTQTNGVNWVIPVFAKFIRARLTAYTSGTVTGTAFLRAAPSHPRVVRLASSPGSDFVGLVGTGYRTNNTLAASVVSVLSPATPAAATIKGSAGRLIGWQLQNSAAALRSVKIFNATAPTLGTTAAVFEIDIPAGGVRETTLEGGIGFSTAMTYSVTSAKGLTDNTATGLVTNDVSGAFFFA